MRLLSFLRIRTFIVAVLIFLVARNFIMVRPGALEAALSYATYPVLVFHSFFIRPIKQWYISKQLQKDIEHQFEAVVRDRNDLLKQLVEYKALLHEYQTLPELQMFAKRYRSDYMTHARVLARHLADDAQTMLIDAGFVRGVIPDMVVVVKNNLIGRVSEVFAYYSKVILITDGTCKVAAMCAQTGAKGILEGKNSMEMLALSYVSHLQQVETDDFVLSTGEGLIFPRGFCLGRILEHSVQGLTHSIKVKPVIDFATLDECYVLQKGAEYKE